jgi:hypothetical protein
MITIKQYEPADVAVSLYTPIGEVSGLNPGRIIGYSETEIVFLCLC